MAAKDEPPQSVRTFHTDMVKKLDELFPVEQGSWTKTRNEVQMKDLLTASDLGKVTNMLELFIKLMEKGKIKYGRYTTICDILKYYNADAGEIIERYTGLIKEALNTGVPTLIINNKLYSLTKGKPAILKCGITSTTVIRNVQWKRKRKGEVSFRDIQKDNKNFSGGSIDSPSLTIDMASEEDNGAIYLCNATNDAGTGQSDEIHVTITQPETDAAAGDALKKTVREMLENTMKEAEDQINKFVEPLGGIEDFKITTDRDTRVITVQFIVKNGMKKHKECLQKQIQHILGFKERTFNFEIIISCIIVSFDITGVTHPLDESALALAERFSTGLEDGSIFLTDETGNPLQIQQNSLKIKMKKTADAAVDVSLPMVSIDQAAYIGATGEIAILKSRLLTSTPITSVAWFRIENEDKTEHVIEIDNEKYFGGSIESPSLVIDDIKVDDAGRYVCHAANRFGGGKSFATCLCVFNSENSETGFAAIQAETSLKDSQSEVSSEKTSDDDSVTQTFTENESHDKFLTSAVAGGHTNTEKLLLEKGRDHYDVPFQGLAAEDNPPSEVLKIHSETVEKLGKRKISRDSDSETENEGRESPQRKDNLETFLALQPETSQRDSQESLVPYLDMATDFSRLPEILKLHTDMVQKLGELFPVKGTKWHTILKKVQLLNLLSVADVEKIETMYDLFLSLVQKKDNGITYGEYTSTRTILGSCNIDAEEIIDHYTGRIHAFYKDNLKTVLALQAETSQRDNQSSISAKTTSDDESMAQLVTEKVSPVAKKITFTSGKDQLTSSKCEEADVNPLYKEKRVKRNECGYPTGPSSFRHKKLKMGCNIGVMNQKVPNLGGTLGPFVRYNGNTSFLTCAHVLFDVAQQGTVDFTYDGSNRIDVVQPALDTSMASGAACGFIQRAIFNPRMHPSIDMAVVTISDESRLPDKGRFANDHSSRYKKAGFKHLPEYNDGSRVLDFQESGTSNMVVQFGSETHLSKGFLKEDGIQVRPLTTVLGLPQSKDIFRMSGQYEVEGLRSMPNLFMPGDSGAAVFMLNGTSLHCIGMAIGSTSTGNAVVTPIAALLDAVRANADIDLSVFP